MRKKYVCKEKIIISEKMVRKRVWVYNKKLGERKTKCLMRECMCEE